LIAQTAVRSSSVGYAWQKRKHGKSRNSLIDLLDQAINGFVSTSRLPARIALVFGFFLSFLGILGALTIVVMTIIGGQNTLDGIPTLLVAVFCFSGFQLLFLGIIGEYVLSIHSHIRRAPSMFEVERVNFDL
jgi:hypothetical protein